MDKSESVQLKASLEFKEHRHIVISRHENYASLRSKLITNFPLLQALQEKADITLKWQDKDKDWIDLSSDTELQNALRNVPNNGTTLKLQVSVYIRGNNTTPEVFQATVPVADHDLRSSTPADLELATYVKGQPASHDSTDWRGTEAEKGHQSFESIGHQPEEESMQSKTSDQYDGMYSSLSSSMQLWPNEETCSLSRIQQVPLQRQPSIPRDNAYPITDPSSKNRGRVVIINNKRFDTMGPLTGTDTDSTCISEVFKRLNYSVKPYSNKTSKEIQKILNDEYIHLCKYGNNYDMFVLILLTRCEDNYVYGKDGCRDLQFWQILEGFNSIPSFHGKPKIIIAEGCGKGGNTTSSELRPADIILQKIHNPRAFPINVREDQLTRGVSMDETDAQAYTPEIKDTFFYCGYTFGSGAPHVKGSLMLQALKDALLNSAGDCSLQQMIPLAEEMIKSAQKTSEDGFTMPMVVKDTLEKDVYFI